MKILFITLSNIGDCILTLPVLDSLRRKYPQAVITCLVPERPKEIFINNPAVQELIIFDKHAKLTEKLKLFFTLSRKNFDLVVDLRNSFFGAFLPVKKRNLYLSCLRRVPAKILHRKQKHLFWARMLDSVRPDKKFQSLNITSQDLNHSIPKNKSFSICPLTGSRCTRIKVSLFPDNRFINLRIGLVVRAPP